METPETDSDTPFSKEEEAEAIDRLLERHKEIYDRLAKL